MATTSRLAREQAEKAFAAYIIANKPSSPLASPDVPVFVRKGKLMGDGIFQLENVDEIPIPSIAVACPRTKPHDMGYPVCEVHVLCLTSVDEMNSATPPVAVGATVAAARFGYLANLFGEENYDTVKAAMNRPTSPAADNRVVKNFTMFGFYQTEDMGQETDRHWIDHLVFEAHCQPTDDLDGDGADG